jgi:SAM-dependent methyltransferase
VLFEERSRAESFGVVAERYDRARPSYPPALLEDLLSEGPRRVLDVGCGTGIAARQIAQRGCEVLGVEIDPRMAELARARGTEVEVARFEEWEPGERRFDLLTSGQAWHWVEPIAGAARAAQALRPGGRIGVFWNFGDPPAHVLERLSAVYGSLEPEMEKFSVVLGNRGDRLQPAGTGIPRSEEFTELRTEVFGWSKTYRTAEWVDHISTHSDHQALGPERLQRLLEAVADAIGQLGGSFEIPYQTILLTARRI